MWQRSDLMFRLLGIKKEQDECLTVLHNFTLDVIKERRELHREAKAREQQQECSEEEQPLGEQPEFVNYTFKYGFTGYRSCDHVY